jgi:hypothetical protein
MESINDVSKYIVDKIKSILDDFSSYEEQVIVNAVLLPYSTTTNAKSVLSDRIDDAIKCKADLNYIILRIKDKKKILQVPFDAEYNKLFTILTRQARPSKQAIDSEIKYTKPELNEKANLLEEYDKLIEYLINMQAVIDLIIRNTENRRYNL